MPPARGPIRVKVKKAKPNPSVFGPIGRADAPLKKAQHQAHVNVQHAQRQIERKTVVPYVPKLKNATGAQRGAAQAIVAKGLRKQGITTKAQVKALPPEQRKRVHRATGYTTTAVKYLKARNALAQGETGRTVRELAAKGEAIDAKTRAQILPNPRPHKIVTLGPANLDLSAGIKTIGKHLAGNPIAAVTKAVPEGVDLTAKKKGAIGLTGRALQDALDLPASTVTSVYLVGKATATGHEGKAVHMLADPIVQTVKHPLKSFSAHPLNTVLIGRGIKGAIGHTAGRVMRSGALGKGAKAAGSTQQAPLEIPGAKREIHRQYSRDVTAKAVQVAHEKIKVRRKKNPTQATAHDIKRAVAEDTSQAKLKAGRNAHEVQQKAKQVLGKKPTAATNLVAQGVTTADRSDLAKYLHEVKAAAPKLKGEMLARNHETQRLITDALKNHDPAKVQEAARAYQQFVATELEPKALAAHLVEPAKAQETRLAGVRVRRNGASAGTKQARQMAGHGEKLARLEASHADAALKQAQADAMTAARVNGGRVPPTQHDALLRAIERNDKAVTALAQRKTTATQARITHTRSKLAPGEEPAYVSQQPIPARTAALPAKRVTAKVKGDRTGQGIRQGTLDAHPLKLVEQAGQTSRLIDAAAERERFAEDYGYRGTVHEPVRRFDNTAQAKAFAQKQGLDYSPFTRQDGSAVLVHKTALDEVKRFTKGVDTNPAFKSYTARWRRLVLAFSPRWLAGNVFEAGVRSLVAGAGPTSYATARRNITAVRRIDPEAAKSLEARTTAGGNFTVAERLAGEHVTAQELGRFGRALHAFGSKPGPKQLGKLYEGYTNVVFKQINGKLEGVAQTAMLGRAMRNHPLGFNNLGGLSGKAAEEAARGLTDTATQAELGRAVDRMYGQYAKFSPGLQNAIANYTPFIAWTLNAVTFLTRVLPADHPVLTGLLASANEATVKWRKQHGLFLDALGQTSAQLPGWLQGSIPGKAGSHLRLSRYTPFGLVENDTGPLETFAGALLPQFQEIVQNFGGKDWQGKPLSKNPSTARALMASVVSFIEGQVPITSQAAAVAGLSLPNDRAGAQRSTGGGTRAREQFDPLRFTPAKKAKKVKVKSGDGFGGPVTSKGDGFGPSKTKSSGDGFGG
jgi:hypothetical protein